MSYKLGAVGFGHWFERLYAGMVKTEQIKLFKIFDESTSKIKHKIYYYLITDLKLKKQKLEKDEEIAVLLFSFKEISYKIKNNLLEDKTDKKALKVLINSITAKNKKFFDLKAKN